MSKFIAESVYKITNEKNEIAICFKISNLNKYNAELALKELRLLKDTKIIVDAKQNKKDRSLKQNSMLWALLEKLAIATTGYSRKEDVDDWYIAIIEEANIDRVFRIALPEDKKELENQYRVVKKVGERTISESQTKVDVFECYKGSSKFNTTQMTHLIDLALDKLAELGVYDSEIAYIKEENKN